MSWQSYVDNALVGSGKVSNAAIHGLDGSLWAASSGFKPSKNEINKMVMGCNDPKTVREAGIRLLGEKYITIRADNGSVYASNGEKGLYATKTGKALILGTFSKPTLPGDAASAVESFAEYLIKEGY